MIELFEQNERKADRQSSKGNQLKWENNGIWYKADCTGYEGLAEYMISHLLKFSSLQKDEFVLSAFLSFCSNNSIIGLLPLYLNPKMIFCHSAFRLLNNHQRIIKRQIQIF